MGRNAGCPTGTDAGTERGTRRGTDAVRCWVQNQNQNQSSLLLLLGGVFGGSSHASHGDLGVAQGAARHLASQPHTTMRCAYGQVIACQ